MSRSNVTGTTLRAGEIAQCRSLLTQRQSVLRAALRDQVESGSPSPHASPAAEVHDLKDDAFASQLANLRGMARDQMVTELAAVGAALGRIIEGSYGRCEDCAGEIGLERLLAQPSTARCVRCQEHAEGGHHVRRQPARHA